MTNKNKLREKAIQILQTQKKKNVSLYEKDLETLVEELNIYQIELEQQNNELKSFQAELMTAKNRFADLFNTAPVGYLIIQPNTKIVEANKTVCKQFNIMLHELKSAKLTDFIESAYQDLVYFHIKKVIKTKETIVDDIKIRIPNHTFFARFVSVLDSNSSEDFPLIRISVIDIHNEKVLEQKLLQEKENAIANEKRWQFSVEASGFGLWDWDIEKKTLFFSQKWYDIVALENENEVHTIEDKMKLIHPDDKEKVEENFYAHLAGKSELYIAEYRIRAKNQYVWVMERGKIIQHNLDHSPKRMIGTLIDISVRKKATQTAIQNMKLNAIGELATGVAHDFNNTLQCIVGNIELALLENLPNDVQNLIFAMRETAVDAATRIKHLQRFAFPENKNEKKHDLVYIKHAVQEVIEQSKNLWKDIAQKNNLHYEIKANIHNDFIVLGNFSELCTVFYNLIKNAIQAMPYGGVLEIETSFNDKKGYLYFKDNGVGMDDKTKHRIFQPFFSTKGFEQGKGLGLSNVFTILHEHKAMISVKWTKQNEGTIFELVFPLQDLKKKHSTIQEQKRIKTKHRILWVDDEDMILKFVKNVMIRLHQEADFASNGKDALALIKKNEYDLIISDIGMPIMNGWALAKAIRENNKTVKIVFVSGWGEQVNTKQLESLNIFKTVSKPILIKQIKELIASLEN